MKPHPGPYYVEQDGREPYIVAEGIGRIATMECPLSLRPTGDGHDKATASLFAAAPDLLAACVWLVKAFDLAELHAPEIEQARAAIAKARGGV